jgi:heme-degrading monooxygenase HmoA
MFATTPKPPYYAVIFSSLRVQNSASDDGYAAMSQRMVELASARDGFLGAESARSESGFGITVSYWTSLEAIAAWRADSEHRIAQETGKQRWYQHFEVRISRVERAYSKAK